MDCKAVETTQATSTTHLAQELITNMQCSMFGSRSFTKETSALKMSVVAGHRKLTTNDWEQTSKLILLKLHDKWLKNSTLTILRSFGIWGKLERWKSSVTGCLMRWPKIQKIIVLKCCLLFYATTVNRFSIGLWRAMKSDFIWPLAKTNSVIGPRRSSKAFPKAHLAPKKSRGHCLVVFCWSDPL